MSLYVGSVWQNKRGWSFFELFQFKTETTGGITTATMNQGPAEIPHRKDFIESNSLMASLLQLIVKYYFSNSGTVQLTQLSLHQPLA